MKAQPSVLVAAAVVALSCGGGTGEGPAPADGVWLDTLTAVDSIGIMMGDSNYMFGAIQDFTPLPGGGVAVLDRVTERISLFDESGTFVRSFGRHGEAPGEFQWPVRVEALPDGRFLVIEGVSGRASLLDSAGIYISSWEMEGLGIYPLDAAVMGDSMLVSYNFSMVPGEGAISIRFSLWGYHALTGEVLARFATWDGESSPSTDFTPAYMQFAVDGDRLYLARADSPGWMVEVFDGEGNPVDTFDLFQDRPWVEVESDSEYVPGAYALRFMYQDESSGSMALSTNMPGRYPFVSDLAIGPDGLLWARRGGVPATEWDAVTAAGDHAGSVHMILGDSSSVIQFESSPDGAWAFDAATEDYHRLYRMGLARTGTDGSAAD